MRRVPLFLESFDSMAVVGMKAKRTKATGSQGTGSTQESQDSLEAARNSKLPDSDAEKEA